MNKKYLMNLKHNLSPSRHGLDGKQHKVLFPAVVSGKHEAMSNFRPNCSTPHVLFLSNINLFE